MVGIIVLFAIGLTLLSAPAPRPDGQHLALTATNGAGTRTTAASTGHTVSRQVTAWICFLACALSVANRLHIIIAN